MNLNTVGVHGLDYPVGETWQTSVHTTLTAWVWTKAGQTNQMPFTIGSWLHNQWTTRVTLFYILENYKDLINLLMTIIQFLRLFFYLACVLAEAWYTSADLSSWVNSAESVLTKWGWLDWYLDLSQVSWDWTTWEESSVTGDPSSSFGVVLWTIWNTGWCDSVVDSIEVNWVLKIFKITKNDKNLMEITTKNLKLTSILTKAISFNKVLSLYDGWTITLVIFLEIDQESGTFLSL